jgi:2-hydroxyacyl-CoA lyase 1
MAAAHNYRSGRLAAVAIVSAGPAVTNAATGILVAWDNCWPLIVLAGTFPLTSSRIKRPGTFQALDGVRVFQSMTKWSAEIPSTSKIGEILGHGFQVAISDQPGPVYLEIPEDALKGTASLNLSPLSQPALPAKFASGQMAQASRMILEAQRPAVIMGKGLRWSEPYEELRSLIETYRIPFITSPMGRGFLPDDHPLCFNVAREYLQQEADNVLLLGARLNWTFRFGRQFAQNAKLIHIDIAQDELVDNRPGSIGIRGDVKQVLRELLGYLDEQKQEAQGSLGREKWLERLCDSRQTQTLNLEKKLNISTLPMSPHRLMKEIRDFLPRNAICVLDGRDTMAAAQEVLLSYEPATRFTAGSNGCMGIGIPFAIGAKLSAPDRLVVVVTGDMAFGISAMEMETAVRHKIPIIVLVVNNDGGCAMAVHKNLYPPDHELVAMFQPKIPYEKIMEACGGYAESVDQPEQVQPALRRAVESGVPACLNVYVDPHAPFVNYLG